MISNGGARGNDKRSTGKDSNAIVVVRGQSMHAIMQPFEGCEVVSSKAPAFCLAGESFTGMG